MGAVVKGYALNAPTNPSLFEEAKVARKMESEIGDIRNLEQLTKSMQTFSPDILIHMAAQPLVRLSYKEPIETYDVNVMGTVKVLEAARNCSDLKAIVSVTTDKCYENKEWVWGYREDEAMGGYDPYSSSKGCAELVASSYRRSFMQEKGVGLATARAGNVIGGGDWADDRLIPDILRAFEKESSVIIRNPASTRPWQHVLEPLSGYIVLAQKLYQTPLGYAEGWNFGPYDDDAKPVDWILNKMVAKWPDSSWQLDQDAHPHEAGYLKLDISKAKSRLQWQPTWQLEKTLERIVAWHQAWLNKQDMQAICLQEINEYMIDMNNANY
jgi:CDP-glucose 4,6-dehydratase